MSNDIGARLERGLANVRMVFHVLEQTDDGDIYAVIEAMRNFERALLLLIALECEQSDLSPAATQIVNAAAMLADMLSVDSLDQIVEFWAMDSQRHTVRHVGLQISTVGENDITVRADGE